MNKEQIFWLGIIVMLNFVAYLISKHEGKREGQETTIAILEAVAPNEISIAKDKLNRADPWELAIKVVNRKNAEKR